MKLTSLLVALCFSMNVFASTGTIQELEKHLDDYHYALSVEWDQKDVKFHEEKTKDFLNKMEKMITEDGLTQSQVVTLIEKKMKSQEAVDLLKLKLSLMGDINSPEELSKIMREFSSDFYTQGASWNGAVVIPLTIVATLVVALGFSMWYSATHGCVEWEQKCDWYGCRNGDVCKDYGYTGPHL